MKRRNLLHTGIAAVLLLSTGACEDFKFGNAFLDKPFTTDITIDTVYAHKVYAEQALAEVYRSLPDYLPSGGRLCWGILEGMTWEMQSSPMEYALTIREMSVHQPAICLIYFMKELQVLLSVCLL